MEPHDGSGLLVTFVMTLVYAFIGGLAARSVKLPPLLGYLAAGIFLGPFTHGFIANQSIASELAEIGVALLLFNIGLHFSFKELMSTRSIVVPGALIQVFFAGTIGFGLAHMGFGHSVGAAIVIGLCVAVASTAVTTRVLDERHQIPTTAGRLAMGWLVVQDIVMVLALVLLPVLKGVDQTSAAHLAEDMGKAFLQIAGFAVVMVFGGRRVIPRLLNYVARVGSRELFTLAVIVIALGIAYGSAKIFGVSLALGAFFAGVVIGESDMNHHAAAEALSLQQVFTILFFVSVGMLFDPRSMMNMPFEILCFLLLVIIGIGATSFALMVVMGVGIETAALVGGAFSQIGEFSFILAEIGYGKGILPQEGRDLILAVALMSILINPLITSSVIRAARYIARSHWGARLRFMVHDHNFCTLPDGYRDHVILAGRGRVGKIIATALRDHNVDYVSIESDRKLVEKLRGYGEKIIYGDASREPVLRVAQPETARLLIVAVPDGGQARRIVSSARRVNPSLQIATRIMADDDARFMDRQKVGVAVMGEREIAFGLLGFSLQYLGIDLLLALETIRRLRTDIAGDDKEEGHVSS